MKIIQKSFTTLNKKWTREFGYVELPGCGASFPCSEKGEINEDDLAQAGLANLRECLSGKGETIINQDFEKIDDDYVPIIGTGTKIDITIIDLGIETWEKTSRTPAIGACDRCSTRISLSNFTNHCSCCGAMYSIGGSRLHDNPSEWIDGTDDHLTDLLRI